MCQVRSLIAKRIDFDVELPVAGRFCQYAFPSRLRDIDEYTIDAERIMSIYNLEIKQTIDLLHLSI